MNYMHKHYRSEKGMVSFVITLVMILVISLIVIGFTQVVMRAQRETMDRQLAAQAQYAAESGVNKAIEVVKGGMANPAAAKKFKANECNKDLQFDVDPDPANSVKVTCVMVNDSPNSIKTSASTTSSSVVRIQPADSSGNDAPAKSRTLTFTWSAAPGDRAVSKHGCAASSSTLLPSYITDSGECSFGLLRVDLLKWNNEGSAANADALAQSTKTLYLVPTKGGGSSQTVSGFETEPKGVLINAACTEGEGGSCSASVTLNDPAGNQVYYARLSTMYWDAEDVTITGDYLASGTSNVMYFKGAQIEIDSTGKAQDVLKRVQVRYPISTGKDAGLPPYALWSSKTICKKFTIVPDPAGGSTVENSCPAE